MNDSQTITIMGLVTTVLGKINPTIGAISSLVTTPGTINFALKSAFDGKNNSPTWFGYDVNTGIIGAAATFNSTAIIFGAAATGVVVTGPIVLWVTLGLTAVALAGNKTLQDILIDPDFYESFKTGQVPDYFETKFGFDISKIEKEIVKTLIGPPSNTISVNTNTDFTAAKTWVAPRDPLVLDLDGDGIEAIGIDPSAPVMFDHDGDGVKTATGWIKADDGIVVLDRDGNGLIDSGRELFGDATVLEHGARAGQLAANGYEALADLDGNADGSINSQDAAYGQLRIWRDLNQDGISQAGELKTLAELGIASLGATGQAGSVSLGGGNTQTMSGGFTKTDGSAGQSASLQLASNNFYRQFTGEVALTAEAQALPQMQGSGLVRDLREAMSLGMAQALELQGDMAAFAAAKKWDSDATKSIADCARGSSARGRFYARQRVCGRRRLTRSDWMSAASRNLRLAFDARAA